MKNQVKTKLWSKQPKFTLVEWRFSLKNQDNKLIIANIYDVPEINKLLLPGDIIVQIDNRNTTKSDSKKLCEIEDYLKDKTAIILTKNDGTKIKVKKTDYVKYFE